MKFSKNIILLSVALFFTSQLFGQDTLTVPKLKSKLADIVNSPDLYNDAFLRLRSALINQDSIKWDFIRKLDLKFKTFEADNMPTALGFEYKYDNSWTKRSQSADFTQTFNLSLSGNVAFKSQYNPNDFLESKLTYNLNLFAGGKVSKNTLADAARLKIVGKEIVLAEAAGDEQALAKAWDERHELVSISNMFFLGANATFAYEANQAFTQQQFAPGLLVNVGFKPWNRHSGLRWLNLADYPFALLRWVTGSSNGFVISRASFPSLVVGVDHVIPTADSIRKSVTGEIKSFNRFRFEVGFKTEAAVIGKQVIWFTADYRRFNEIGAAEVVKKAKIDQYNYFTFNLSSSNGFFVSYTHGRLPFDIKSNNVYGIGFNYNLGNWK